MSKISLRSFGQQIVEFLPIAREHMHKLSYTIPHTNPRLFNIITSNIVFIEVLRNHVPIKRIEMVVVLNEDNRKRGRCRRKGARGDL